MYEVLYEKLMTSRSSNEVALIKDLVAEIAGSTRRNSRRYWPGSCDMRWEFSPTTMYQDYAISPKLFHWESQSTTSAASKTGQRYLNHYNSGLEILIVSREAKLDPLGTMAYTFLGIADYVSHSGDRPIGITWQLRRPMPADLFARARVAS